MTILMTGLCEKGADQIWKQCNDAMYAQGVTWLEEAAYKEVAVSAVQPGDLLFYASGNYINHVALYIGNGQVIHASTAKSGIKISPSNYRTPCKAVSFLN